ncbi:hypothetical protein [Mycobacterium sp. C31M]
MTNFADHEGESTEKLVAELMPELTDEFMEKLIAEFKDEATRKLIRDALRRCAQGRRHTRVAVNRVIAARRILDDVRGMIESTRATLLEAGVPQETIDATPGLEPLTLTLAHLVDQMDR